MSEKNRLNKGLDFLLSTGTAPSNRVGEEQITGLKGDSENLRNVPVDLIQRGKYQPRIDIDNDSLGELAASIEKQGIMQPIVIRPISSDKYEIIAGERRWRACQLAGFHEIPAIIKPVDDESAIAMSLIENIQREDLNPIEEAIGYKSLMDNFDHTQEGLSKEIGKSRSHIANLLRLLNLPTEVQEFLISGQLTSGHARALVTCENPLTLAKKIISLGLSVRDAERLVRNTGQKKIKTKAKTKEKPADTILLEADLSLALKMKVSINHEEGKEKGLISISYGSLDELDRISEVILNSS